MYDFKFIPEGYMNFVTLNCVHSLPLRLSVSFSFSLALSLFLFCSRSFS